MAVALVVLIERAHVDMAGGPLPLGQCGSASSGAGRGVGRALLESAESEARSAGFDSLYLYTHEKMTENLALLKLGCTPLMAMMAARLISDRAMDCSVVARRAGRDRSAGADASARRPPPPATWHRPPATMTP